MSTPLCVRPDGDQYVVTAGTEGENVGGPFDSRSEAIRHALDTRGNEAVLLLRADGSVHGELHHATPQPNEEGQTVEGAVAGEGSGA